MNVDPATFESVVNMFYQPLYRFALTLARCEATAADLTQETFRRFATKGHQLRDAAKLKTWLFTTLYREFLRVRADERRMESLESADVPQASATSTPTCETAVDAQTALAALLELTEVFRAPLALFYLKEHSYEEIAAILGVPIGTVMSRLSRGRELLRQRLQPKAGGNAAVRPLVSVSS